jgi:outer membrane lipoprotein-sorting protein
MKRIALSLLLIFSLFISVAHAQSAKEVLDKCAASVSAKDGVRADFAMSSAQYGNASGSIAVKGQMFCAQTNLATMWFDGKTLWTYMAKNDEVNVTTPTTERLQTLNPYNFINLYKQGFKYTMTKADKTFNVHLTAKDKNRNVQEMFISVDKSTYHPTEVKILQKQKWTTFTISNLKVTNLSDDAFRFNSKDFPSAEVIDLR